MKNISQYYLKSHISSISSVRRHMATYLPRIFMLAILLIVFTNPSNAQIKDLWKTSPKKIGFVLGYGVQNLGQIAYNDNLEDRGLSVDYNYQVKLYQFQYSLALKETESWGLDLLILPQFNFTTLNKSNLTEVVTNGFEYGVNVGVLVRKTFISENINIYGLISLGPHYVSETPNRQTEGFIFSDNIFIGTQIKIYESTYLDLRTGIRHISNANIQTPNGGVNNIVVCVGVLKDL